MKVHVLGAGDVLDIDVLDAQEASSKRTKISSSGTINLPMLGTMDAAGITSEALAGQIARALSHYYVSPKVSVNVVEIHSSPVSVIGAVRTPGVQYMDTPKSLVELISTAGGLREDAAEKLTLTRKKAWGPIPLAQAHADSTGGFSVAEIQLAGIMDASKPANNVLVMPEDVISVPRADMVYVLGEVKKPGGILLRGGETIPLLRAVSLAEGLNQNAAAADARILRADVNGKRQEIHINLKLVLQGKAQDINLQPNDLLFVPASFTRSVLARSLEAVVQSGASAVIFRPW